MFSIANEKTWIRICLSLLAFIVLLLNVYTVLQYGNYFILGSFEKMDNDDVKYIRTAKILLEKGMLVDLDINRPTANEMPGHAFTLAFFFKLFGYENGLTIFRIYQSILQSLCIFLIFFIGRKTISSKAGIIAAFLSSLYIPDLQVSGLAMMCISFKFYVLLLIYLTIYAVDKKSLKLYFASGFFWGIACLYRPTIALFPILVLILWIIKKYTVKEMLKFGLASTVIFCAILSPWWIRNYITFHRFIPLSTATGNPMLQGTYINYDQTKDHFNYLVPKNNIEELDRIESETSIARLRVLIPKQPVNFFLWYTLGKTQKLWEYPFYWKIVYNISFTAAEKYHKIIINLGLLGIILVVLNKKLRQKTVILPLMIIYITILHLPYYTFARYAYPVMPLMFILSSYSLTRLFSKDMIVFFRNRILSIISNLKFAINPQPK